MKQQFIHKNKTQSRKHRRAFMHFPVLTRIYEVKRKLLRRKVDNSIVYGIKIIFLLALPTHLE